jgi:FkbM family methyltransferase
MTTTTERTLLRSTYERGALDKHAYARRMSELHAVLSEYCGLLAGTDIAAIRIDERHVVLESRFGGVRFPSDPGDRGIPPMVALNFRSYERKDFEMLRRLVPRGATFFDVGANIGWYSLHVAAADPAVTVYAFEPVPSSFGWLRAGVELNGLRNVEPVAMAVSDRTGDVVLYVDEAIAGAASAAPSTDGEGLRAVRCRSTRLDDFARERNVAPDVVKLDIEGGELAALRGAPHILATHRPIVFCEMLRKLAKPFGYHPNDIIALLGAHGYACYRAEGSRLEPFASRDDATTETNFFFLHADKHRLLIAELAATPAR